MCFRTSYGKCDEVITQLVGVCSITKDPAMKFRYSGLKRIVFTCRAIKDTFLKKNKLTMNLMKGMCFIWKLI